MGPIAARHAQQIADNVECILAIELLAAAQGIDFRREAMPGARLGRGTAPAYQLVRKRVPFLERDAVLSPHIEAVRELVASGQLMRAVDRAINDDISRRKP
jgi:histidine ammonia-lyase